MVTTLRERLNLPPDHWSYYQNREPEPMKNAHYVALPHVGKPKPYRIIPSEWSPGKFVIKYWTGHSNLLFKAQFKLLTSVRFNSIASAMNWLKNNHG